MTEPVELLSAPTKYAVVRLPGRKFPGVVVQGDALNEFSKDLEIMRGLLEAGKLDELMDEISCMRDQFVEALNYYEQICSKNKIQLPYPKPVGL